MTQIYAQTAVSNPAAAVGSLTLPDFTNCQGEWWFNTNAASSPNAISGAAPTQIGTPPFGNNFATIGYTQGGPANGFTLDINMPGNVFTWAALFRPVGSGKCIIAAPAGNPLNASLMTSGSLITSGNGFLYGPVGEANLPIIDATKFNFVMGVGLLNTPSSIIGVSGGASQTVATATGASSNLPTSRPTAAIQIGAAGDNNTQGSVDLAAFAAFSDQRGSTFAQALYAQWSAYAAALGLSVA